MAVETAGLLQICSGFEFTALLAAGDAAREPADGGFWAATDGGTEALFRFWMTPQQGCLHATVVEIGVAIGPGWNPFGSLPVATAEGARIQLGACEIALA